MALYGPSRLHWSITRAASSSTSLLIASRLMRMASSFSIQVATTFGAIRLPPSPSGRCANASTVLIEIRMSLKSIGTAGASLSLERSAQSSGGLNSPFIDLNISAGERSFEAGAASLERAASGQFLSCGRFGQLLSGLFAHVHSGAAGAALGPLPAAACNALSAT